MDIERISATEEAILDVLACYRFLTPNQMFRLGVTAAKPHLYATLRKLQIRKPAVISVLDFGALPRRGRLSRLYALTPYGAEVTADARRDGEIIETPKRIRAFVNDYFHRLACLDFHIALRAWAERSETTINFFHTYYDPLTGADATQKHRQKTKIKLKRGVLIPDAIFSFTTPDGSQRLCAFEMYNGRRTDRVTKQLAAYCVAQSEGAIEKAYGYAHGTRILCVFEDKEGLQLVSERVQAQNTLAGHNPFFFAKTLGEVDGNFALGWRRFSGDTVPLFPN